MNPMLQATVLVFLLLSTNNSEVTDYSSEDYLFLVRTHVREAFDK